jgi:hypothetical protein
MGHQTRGCAESKTVNQPGIPDADRAHPPAGVDVSEHGNMEAHMHAVEDFRSWLGLVAKDLCDAHAADRMLTNMSVREDRTSEFERSEAISSAGRD